MTEKDRKILILDDNPQILEMVVESLHISGFTQLLTAQTKQEALHLLKNEEPELAILDIMLPDGSGFEVLEAIRRKSTIPVLFLSAISDIEKQYQGFELGADDYLVKPFRPKELELRLLSILRRAYPQENEVLQLIGSQIDFKQAQVIKDQEILSLTAKEYSILKTLYDHKNRILTIDQVLEEVWGPSYQGYENTLMAHIRKIRQKIELEPSSPKNLITIKGLGYQLRV